MKKIIALGLALLMVIMMVSAAASTPPPGSPGNPLITRNFLEGRFRDELRENINASLEGAVSDAVSRLDYLYRIYSGYSFAPSFRLISLEAGETVSLAPGASFILQSGSATLSEVNGTVINVTTGNEVARGASLSRFNRIFSAENTSAVITAGVAATAQVDGFHRASGEGITPRPPQYQPRNPFVDVSATDWFHDAVVFVFEIGIMRGTSTTPMLFSPELNLTRAMFVTSLYRLEGAPAQDGNSVFSDVRDPNSFYHDAVIWANARGIVLGHGDGTFRPSDNVTREQMATFLFRYASYKELDLSSYRYALLPFPDPGQISGFAADAMRWAVSHEIIRGSNGQLLPLNTATRAQVAQIFLNFYSSFVQ